MLSPFARSAVLACSAAVILAASASSAHAYFSDFSEWPPRAPITNDAVSAQQYVDDVQEYANKANEYITRGNSEIERLSAEIESIQRKQQHASEQAQDAINELKSWLMFR